MKHRYLLFMAMLYGCILTACKLDPPVLPGDKNYVANADNTVPGSKDTTGVDDTPHKTDTAKKPPPFTGFWFCKNNIAETYSQAGVLQSSAAADPFYYSITFDSLKSIAAFKLTPTARPAAEYYNYTVTKNAGKTYILFDYDPFFRSANTPIEILNETAVSMTWLIVDHRLYDSANGKTYTANRLELIKTK